MFISRRRLPYDIYLYMCYLWRSSGSPKTDLSLMTHLLLLVHFLCRGCVSLRRLICLSCCCLWLIFSLQWMSSESPKTYMVYDSNVISLICAHFLCRGQVSLIWLVCLLWCTCKVCLILSCCHVCLLWLICRLWIICPCDSFVFLYALVSSVSFGFSDHFMYTFGKLICSVLTKSVVRL